jgi:fatty-acyl-CoA synthase
MNAEPSLSGRSSFDGWLRALSLTAPISQNPARVFPAMIAAMAERCGEAPALLSDRETLTYRALDRRANQFARWALAQNLAKGDAVCLLMPSQPDYLAIWLGLTRVGVVAALLNTNLAGASLAHCVDTAQAQLVIVAPELMETFSTAQAHLTTRPQMWVRSTEVEELSDEALAAHERRPPSGNDRALLIYTSGTTGMPKAAVISHHRLMTWTHWFAGMMDTRPDDRMYNCLPMYHSIGGVVATGALLVNGGSVVIRESFSASQFWPDLVRWECTLFQYIGELCRYLVNSPPHPAETSHRIRMCCGNGLRADVWPRFKERFRIPNILEFYAATEGNVSLFNLEDRPGSLGRVPSFLSHRFPIALIRVDADSNTPLRDAHGFCVRCAPGETGEALGRIAAPGAKSGGRFEGYTDPTATERKILRNVFAEGDAWFRTGDLMRQDDKGFFYFVDRIGDTFRWKGENVATMEVAEAIAAFPGVTDASVYGVAVPGADGRAGMAAIAVDAGFDLAGLHAHLVERLPGYARPLFLRLCPALETTGTFKHKKSDLVRQGFDPACVNDPVYYNDGRAFVPLDAATPWLQHPR